MTDFAARRVMMVDTQVRPSDVTKFPIIAAMLTIPREVFVPDGLREAAYVGDNVALGGGRVVLDARVFAKLLDALDITPDETVLDIGCGLGYSAAVIARIAKSVVAVEEDKAMADQAQAHLAALGAGNALGLAGAEFGILANAVAPGFVRTQMSLLENGIDEADTEEFRKQYVESGRLPLGRASTPEEIAESVLWLSGRTNTYITGQTITIDGGLTATF